MADPVISWLTPTESTTTTTTMTFTAQPAGTLLILSVLSDDVLTTSGAGRPESTSWTRGLTLSTFHNSTLFYKLTDGVETSVQWTNVTGAFRSIGGITAATNIDQVTPLDITVVGQSATGAVTSYTTPTGVATTGRRLGVGMMGFQHGSTAITLQDTWLNSYTEAGDFLSTAVPWLSLGVGTLAFDGDGSTSTSTGSSIVTQTAQSETGILAVFRVASSQNPDVPVLHPPRNLNVHRM